MKKSFKIVMAGLLIAPLLALGLSALQPDMQPVAAGVLDGARAAQGDDQPTELFGDGGIFQIIVNTILYVLGAISVIMLVYGGVRYTISGGDSTQVTAAKSTIMYAIIGLVVALLAYAIVNFVLGNLTSGI